MNTVLVVVWLALFGLVLGSFINALIWRLYNKRNWVSERSECPHCHHTLAPKDLIPVVSYLMLKGKCRYCHKKIEDTPLAELLLPVLFILSYAFWPTAITGAGTFLFAMWLVILVFFVALALYDLRWFLLPNKVVFPLIGLTIGQVLALPLFYDYAWSTVVDAALGAIILSGLFYLLFQLSKGTWIGGGDVKLAIALGLIAGDPLRAMLILFMASLVGTLAALPTLIKNKNKRGIKLPFGPLLIAGTIIVQLFGSDMIAWYTSLLSV